MTMMTQGGLSFGTKRRFGDREDMIIAPSSFALPLELLLLNRNYM